MSKVYRYLLQIDEAELTAWLPERSLRMAASTTKVTTARTEKIGEKDPVFVEGHVRQRYYLGQPDRLRFQMHQERSRHQWVIVVMPLVSRS